MRHACVAALVALSLSGCNAEWDGVKGQYPPPASKYDGLTAVEWSAKARDTNPSTVRQAAEVLHGLGAEGVPYLIGATEHHANARRFELARECLCRVDGEQVASGDLDWLARYLRKASPGAGPDVPAPLRIAALVVVGQAGPKAGRLVPLVREIAADSEAPEGVRAQAGHTLSALECR